MQVETYRFGTLQIQPDELITFPSGLLGLENCRHWLLLADTSHDALGWLQSISDAKVAVAVVSPRRFMADYRVRVARSEILPLECPNIDELQVLVIVGKGQGGLTLNLKAPLLISVDRHLGRQVVVNDDQPVQYPWRQAMLKKSA